MHAFFVGRCLARFRQLEDRGCCQPFCRSTHHHRRQQSPPAFANSICQHRRWPFLALLSVPKLPVGSNCDRLEWFLADAIFHVPSVRWRASGDQRSRRNFFESPALSRAMIQNGSSRICRLVLWGFRQLAQPRALVESAEQFAAAAHVLRFMAIDNRAAQGPPPCPSLSSCNPIRPPET